MYRREQHHYFGMIRTFIVELFLKIKVEDYKDDEEKFLDILYDDAMQQPMFEMAGRHIQYIP